MFPKTSFIIPAYNEGRNISECLSGLKKALDAIGSPYEIIVINDGSKDDTGQKARNAGATVIEHARNMGYGRSLKDGIRQASGEYIYFMDADGTYDISKIPEMLKRLEGADLVVGKRVFTVSPRNHLKNVARRFFMYQVSYYSGTKIEDLNSGQRVFRKKDVIDSLHDYPDGFSFTSTQVVLYTLSGKKIAYTPVVYKHRERGSKFMSRAHIVSMAKLSLGLTLRGRPLLFFFQIALVIAAAALLSKIEGDMLGATFLSYMASFIILVPLCFLAFLCYIYGRGRAVCRQC